MRHEGSRDLLSSWKRGEGLLLIYWPKELTRANQLVELTEMQARVVLPLFFDLARGTIKFVVLPDRSNLFASRTTSFTQHKGRMGSIPITIRLGRSLREQNTLLDKFAFLLEEIPP